MDTPIIVTPSAILLTLLILTSFVALVFLCVCLYKLIRLLCKVNKFVDDNVAPITASIQKLPEITENISVISMNVSEISESAGDIAEGFAGTTCSSSEGGIISTITMISNLIQTVIQVVRRFTGADED